MKKLIFILIILLPSFSCQKEDPQRDYFGTWFCKIGERELLDTYYPIYLELHIDKNTNTTTITPHYEDLNNYWNEGSGTYNITDSGITFDFVIDVPPAYSWWPHASRKIIKGETMPETIYPLLKIEIESTIGDEVTREFLWFRRDRPTW